MYNTLEEIQRFNGREMYWNNPIYLTVKGARIGTKMSKLVNAKCNEIPVFPHKVLSGLNKS